jgi:hypothetical protein
MRSNLNKTNNGAFTRPSSNYRKRNGIPEEDELTIDPKVLEPYDPIPGRVPRKVAIDRKKKEYASFDIEELLTMEVNIIFKYSII